MKPVVLLTDFGHDDHYVGVLHSILLRDAPGVQRIDLVHTVPPGDVWTGTFFLRSAETYLPVEAVILAVVDPGVGTVRRAVAAKVRGRWLVGPDNGLVAALGEPECAFELDPETMGVGEPSATFHGRDVFAPAAARLARGDSPESLGPHVDASELEATPMPLPVVEEGRIEGIIQHIDRFGNAVTNVRADQVPEGAEVRTGWNRVRREVATYGNAPADTAVFLTGSSGFVELAMCGQSVASVLNIRLGDRVEVTVPQAVDSRHERAGTDESADGEGTS